MHRSTRWTLGAAALLALLPLTTATSANAAVYTVSKTADTADGACDSDCSLREAVLAANASSGADFILLGPGTYGLTRAGAGEDLGATGDLDLQDDVALVGAGADRTTIDGGQLDRVLDVQPGARVEIQGVAIQSGRVAGPGGGVRNQGSLTIARSSIQGNLAAGAGSAGGGLWSSGASTELSLTDSTVLANFADGVGGGLALGGPARISNVTITANASNYEFGGGVYVFANTDARFFEVTIAGNRAARQGGGIFAEGSPFTGVNHPELKESILAQNDAASQVDCSGAVRSGGNNLVGDGFDCIDFKAAHNDLVGTTAAPVVPRLRGLTNNGGTTQTLALLAGSPAIGRGTTCGDADQRGQARPETGCDLGAFQTSTACIDGGVNLCLNNDRFRVTTRWRTPQGQFGEGTGVSLTSDSGYFWFSSPSNLEVTVKVLNACNRFHQFWVFLSGLTNVEVVTTVTDTQTGAVKTYVNPQGTAFRTTLDTKAFSCP